MRVSERRGLSLLDKSLPAALIFSIVIGLFIAQRFPFVAVLLCSFISFGVFVLFMLRLLVRS